MFLPIWFSRKFEYFYEIFLRTTFGSQFSFIIKTNNNYNERFQVIEHKNKNGEIFKATFFTPNQICQYRVNTFSTKEPKVLDWIDNYGDNGIFFDVGANIGLYSIYFSIMKGCSTYAFEPSVFNLHQLAKNISINKLHNKINLISNPLSKTNLFSNFILSDNQEGSSNNGFGINYGYDGMPIKKYIEYSTLGFSIDSMIKTNLIKEIPTMIKIDVDGIEYLILEGAVETLGKNECKTVYIEVNDNRNIESNKINQILTDCGFILKNKFSVNMIEQTAYVGLNNQIWVKN